MSISSSSAPVASKELHVVGMSRTSKLVFLLLVLLQAGFFLYISLHRLIDDDEGFYLLASRLVLQHKTPYLDFFYTQAPLLPYVYGAWLKVAGVSWFSARIFSALLTTAVGSLLYWHVSRETGKWLGGACVVLLFASSSLIFVWYPIAKTYSLAMLFLFSAYIILARFSASTPGWLAGAAGILLGLSVDTRSYLVGVAPVFLWWLLRRRQARSLAHVIWFCSGFVAGIVPSLVLFFASPDAYLFNNLGYHAIRSEGGLIGNLHHKFLTLAALMAGHHTGVQFTILAVAAVGFMFYQRVRRDSVVLAIVLAVVLGMISLLPNPPYVQYFCLVLPFLMVVAVCSADDYLASSHSLQARRRVTLAGSILLLVFVAAAVPVLRQYLLTGHKVEGLQNDADAPNWTLKQVTVVAKTIDQLAVPGQEVASFWPGYTFASHANPYPGWENNFGSEVARELPPDKRRHYRLLSAADMDRLFAQREPRLVVLGNQFWNAAGNYALWARSLQTYGYTLARTVGDTSIYQCCSQAQH